MPVESGKKDFTPIKATYKGIETTAMGFYSWGEKLH